MFICSVRSTSLKFAAVVLAGVLIVTALVFILPDAAAVSQTAAQPGTQTAAQSGELPGGKKEDLPEQPPTGVRLDGMKDIPDMKALLEELGYEVETPPLSDKNVVIPEEYSAVFAEYVRLQEAQGLSLAKLTGKEVRKVTFVVRDRAHTGDNLLATLFVYRSAIVGADLTTQKPNGAVFPLLPGSVDRSSERSATKYE